VSGGVGRKDVHSDVSPRKVEKVKDTMRWEHINGEKTGRWEDSRRRHAKRLPVNPKIDKSHKQTAKVLKKGGHPTRDGKMQLAFITSRPVQLQAERQKGGETCQAIRESKNPSNSFWCRDEGNAGNSRRVGGRLMENTPMRTR